MNLKTLFTIRVEDKIVEYFKIMFCLYAISAGILSITCFYFNWY